MGRTRRHQSNCVTCCNCGRDWEVTHRSGPYCPYCGFDNGAVAERPDAREGKHWRRPRLCKLCGEQMHGSRDFCSTCERR